MPSGAYGCWLWVGHIQGGGYGTLHIRPHLHLAHRLSWELNVGPIPEGQNVLHHCDNPPCVRPSHLFLGSHADNVRDMVAKGRNAKGERNGANTHPERWQRGDDHWSRRNPERVTRGSRHGKSKLTEYQVRNIRRLKTEGWTERRLAAEFGVREGTIHFIVMRQTWKHVE